MRSSLLSLLFLTCLSYGEGQESHIPQTPGLSAAGFFSPLGLRVLSAPTAAGYLKTFADSDQLCIPLPTLGRIYRTTLDCFATGINILHREERKTANMKRNAESQESCTQSEWLC